MVVHHLEDATSELVALVVPDRANYILYHIWVGLCTVVPALCGLFAIGKLSQFWDHRCFQRSTKPTRTRLHLYPKLRALFQLILITISGRWLARWIAYLLLNIASLITEQSTEAVLEEAHSVIHWDGWSLAFNWAFNLIKVWCLLTALPSFFGLLYPTMGNKSTADRKRYDDRTLIVFRWVTRGTAPDLVRTNMAKNWQILKKYNNVKMEVVTDTAIGVNVVKCGIPKHCFDEIVIPKTYKTPNNTLFKARALYYASMNSKLAGRGSYIFHCDEESTVTDQLMVGVKEFVTSNYGKIGQGLITYVVARKSPCTFWWATSALVDCLEL